MRQYDFALKLHSRDTAKLSYQTQLEAIQRFSIDADVSFDRALNMPYWLLDDFYKNGPWNIKKSYKQNDDQIKLSVIQLLKNICNLLKS